MGFLTNILVSFLLTEVTVRRCQAQDEAGRNGIDDGETAILETRPIKEVAAQDRGQDMGRSYDFSKELVSDKSVLENENNIRDHLEDEREKRTEDRRRDHLTVGGNRRGRLHKYRGENGRKLKKTKLQSKHSHSEQKNSQLKESELNKHGKNQNIARYYLQEDLTGNMSAPLGPGPIPISMNITYDNDNYSVETPSSMKGDSSLILSDTRNLSSVLEDIDSLSAYRGEHKKSHKRKFKHDNKRPVKNENSEIDLRPHLKSRRKLNKNHHKHDIYHESNHNNKNRKLKKIHNGGVKSKENLDKYVLKDSDMYTNLSTINKSFMNKAGKQFYEDLKHGRLYVRPVDVRSLDISGLRNSNNGGMVVIDVLDDRDAKKMELINELRKREDKSAQKKVSSLSPENINHYHRHKTLGSKSKIAYGDWLPQITIWPPIDTLANKTQYKKRVSLSESKDRDSISVEGKKQNYSLRQKVKHLFDNKQTLNEENLNKNDKNDHDILSHTLSTLQESEKNKRHQRDTFRKFNTELLKRQRGSNVISREFEKAGESQEFDSNEGEFSFENHRGNKNTHEDSHKEDDYYEYGEKYNENEVMNTQNLCPNRTEYTNEVKPTASSQTTECKHSTITPSNQNKQKITTRTSSKTPSSKLETEPDKMKGPVDPYEMFLCGQLADDFVEAVLNKVRRSKKIQRELGFANDTEETCDRCIELKPLNIPDASVMKSSMGQCLRNYKPVRNCSMCCSVPKPMLRFLNVLIYHEMENENSFYNRIQDDSSFIFTGDYTDSLKGENKVKNQDGGFFDKDTYDKQHLREEINEEKYDERNPSQNSLAKDKGTTLLAKETKKKESLESSIKKTGEGEAADESKRNVGTVLMNKNSKSGEREFQKPQKSIRDFGSRIKNMASVDKRYPIPNDRETEFGESRKHERAKSESNDYDDRGRESSEFKNSERSWSPILKNSMKSQYLKNNYEYDKNIPLERSRDSNSNKFSAEQVLSEQNSIPGRRSRMDNNRPMPSYNMLKDNVDNSHKIINYYGYRNTDEMKPFDEENEYKSKYDGLSYTNWDEGEYALYPNLDSRNYEEVYDLNRHFNQNEDDNLRMVKRDAETEEGDDFLFMEIPNSEYDLYDQTIWSK